MNFSNSRAFIAAAGETELLFLPTAGEGDQYDALQKSLMVLSV